MMLATQASANANWYQTAPFLPFSDSQLDIPESRGGVTVHRRNSMAVLRLRTDATGLLVDGLSSQTNASNQNDLGVYVNGAWLTNLAFTSVDTLTTVGIALPGGANQLVEIWEGAQLDSSGVKGVYVYAVRGAATMDPAPSPAKRTAVYGDSIACGYYATIPVKDGWFPQARLAYQVAGGRMACEAWGGRALGSEADVDALAARLVAHVAGSATRAIVLFIGTNDFGQSVARATFLARYGQLLDGIRSRDTGAAVYCVQPLFRTDQAVTNGVGAILADYRADIATARSTRTWASLVDASGWVTAPDLVGDGVHPSDTGHGKVLTQVRAMLGF